MIVERFIMQEEDIDEHTNAKCHVLTLTINLVIVV